MVSGLIGIAIYLYVAGAVVLVIWEDRDPATTLAWLLVLIFLPVVGIPLYILFGRDWRWRGRRSVTARRVAELAEGAMAPIRRANADLVSARRQGAEAEKVVRSVLSQGGSAPLPADTVQIIASGAQKFSMLLADIATARDSIHLQYYAWECDELTGRIVGALEERVRAGVDVRLTYDFIGSLRYGKSQLRRLAASGASVLPDVRSLAKINYRNHRKIVVIDGVIGYVGGFNVGSEYVDGGRRFPAWRDTHLRITGPFVSELQQLFASRWYEARRGSLFGERYFPVRAAADPDTAAILQAESSSVESAWETIRHSYIVALTGAKERAWISSPYFVPDQSVYDALIATALAGVEVRLLMTGLPDKRAAWWAAQSYYPRLLEAGGHIHLYEAGFYHAKTLAIDSTFCSIGTANIDVRSFELDSEVTVWIHDRDVTMQQERLFEEDLAHSREVTLEEVASYSAWRRLRSSVMRLGAKLL
jgi:cardiolipin synthase A/B